MEFQIPCETVARLAKVLRVMTYDANIWFNSIRIDNGVAIASNRAIMAVEQIGGPSGVIHIPNDPVLIAQCETEAPFASVLHITLPPGLQWASAKTDLGYVYPGNASVWSDLPNDMDKWRSLLPNGKPGGAKGGMYWDSDWIYDLGRSSPSGKLIFPEAIDTRRPVVVRDVHDPRWFGLFTSIDQSGQFPAATLPEWVKL